jgi:hypothetical protein
MAKKQQHGLPGLDDPNWMPCGPDVEMAQDLAIKGLRIAYREREDPDCELVPLENPELPLDEQLKYFFYVWAPDISKFTPWLEEEQQVRRKIVRQEKEVVARPRSQARAKAAA